MVLKTMSSETTVITTNTILIMSLNVSTIFLVPHYNYAFIPEYKRTKYKADKVPDAKLIFT